MQSFILSQLLIGCGYQLETTNMKYQRQEYSCSSFPLSIPVDLEPDIGQKIGAFVLFHHAYRVRLWKTLSIYFFTVQHITFLGKT